MVGWYTQLEDYITPLIGGSMIYGWKIHSCSHYGIWLDSHSSDPLLVDIISSKFPMTNEKLIITLWKWREAAFWKWSGAPASFMWHTDFSPTFQVFITHFSDISCFTVCFSDVFRSGNIASIEHREFRAVSGTPREALQAQARMSCHPGPGPGSRRSHQQIWIRREAFFWLDDQPVLNSFD